MADDLVFAGIEALHIGIGDESIGLGDDVDRQPGHISYPRIEAFGGFALPRWTGERCQIIGDGKMLRICERLLTERIFALQLSSGPTTAIATRRPAQSDRRR